MNTLQVSNLEVAATQEPEDCAYCVYDAKPKCVLCGQRIHLERRNWHRGPRIDVDGSFELPGFHNLDSPLFTGLDLGSLKPELDRGGQSLANTRIFVVECLTMESGSYEYRFRGTIFVGVQRVTEAESVESHSDGLR